MGDSERIDIDGRSAYVRLIPAHPPQGTAAEPALYVHGLGGSSTNWADLATLLSDRLDGAAVDLPGFGRSDPAPPRGYSVPRLAAFVARIVEELGRGPVHLVGNSLGGAVCVQLAAARPDLLRTLTLISPAMPDLRPRRGSDAVLPLLLLPGANRIAERRLAAMDPERRAQSVVDLCFADPSRLPPERLAQAVAEVRERSELPWAMDAFTRSLRGLVAAYLVPTSRSLWAKAGQIRVPTLVVWGSEDRLVSVALAARTAAAAPGARLLVLDGVGHTAQLEAPEPVAQAMRALLDDAATR